MGEYLEKIEAVIKEARETLNDEDFQDFLYTIPDLLSDYDEYYLEEGGDDEY